MTRRYYKYEEKHRTVRGRKQKYCIKCKKWKGENQYYKEPRTKDGLGSWCKDCVLKYQRERNRKMGKGLKTLRRYEECHRVVSGVKQKKCTKCKKWKGENQYCRNRRSKDGLQWRCKECVLKYQRERNRKMGKGLKTYRRYEEYHRVVGGVKQKKCTKCKRWKAESEFYKTKIYKDGMQFKCKACSDKATNKSRKKRRLAVQG